MSVFHTEWLVAESSDELQIAYESRTPEMFQSYVYNNQANIRGFVKNWTNSTLYGECKSQFLFSIQVQPVPPPGLYLNDLRLKSAWKWIFSLELLEEGGKQKILTGYFNLP